jgi:hypothetical protein
VARSDGSVTRQLQTGGQGELRIDLRDFYAHDPPGAALRLAVSYSGLSEEVTIPADYVAKARSYEERASALLAEAASYEKTRSYSSASECYAQLLANYPDANATLQAGAALERVNRAKTEQTRMRASAVSAAAAEKRVPRTELARGAEARREYASYMRREFSEDGLGDAFSAKVWTSGEHSEYLHVQHMLVNATYVKYFTDGEIGDEIRGRGFKGIYYSDGSGYTAFVPFGARP